MLELEKKKSKKLKSYQKIIRVREQEFSVLSAGWARAVQLEEMYLPKPKKWPSISESTDAIQQIIPLKKLNLKAVKLRSSKKQ